jgi:hypothetical protein
MKLYAWGADRQEPIEIYSRYNEDGTINMEGATQGTELNKGNIKSSD